MDYKKFECVIYVFPAGTKWEDIPDDWVCPECGVSKFDFELIEE